MTLDGISMVVGCLFGTAITSVLAILFYRWLMAPVRAGVAMIEGR